MAENQLNVNVSFEGELAKYLKDIAEIDNKTVAEILVHLATEALEEDIELSKMIAERDVEGAELIRAEDVDWDKILSAGTFCTKCQQPIDQNSPTTH
ncbi:hypothetical protein L2227_06645 [Wolbachia endosymbiont of Delia radicum]|uniref:hypothetical protein n=1 Tax=unclassified Wolbachia TaxID=2640676 RepID=UPI001F1A1349|nr:MULTISPECIES: hypothetical protein [unclassified Wolbachia]UJQ20815.1 hypothetical protein L2227_06645 [Wolbachia endosymbiont of Delia radicum]